MGFNLGKALSGALGGAATGLSMSGGNPYAALAGAAAGGAMGGFSGDGSSRSTTTNKRTATPVTVIINGKPVTMYSYGPTQSETVNRPPDGGALATLGDILTAGGALRKQMKDSGIGIPGATPGATAAAPGESATIPSPSSFMEQGWDNPVTIPQGFGQFRPGPGTFIPNLNYR